MSTNLIMAYPLKFIARAKDDKHQFKSIESILNKGFKKIFHKSPYGLKRIKIILDWNSKNGYPTFFLKFHHPRPPYLKGANQHYIVSNAFRNFFKTQVKSIKLNLTYNHTSLGETKNDKPIDFDNKFLVITKQGIFVKDLDELTKYLLANKITNILDYENKLFNVDLNKLKVWDYLHNGPLTVWDYFHSGPFALYTRLGLGGEVLFPDVSI